MEEGHHRQFDEGELFNLPRQSICIPDLDCDGWIHIGGGGEGIIGLVGGKQVVAIDISPEELEEVENDSLRIIMDATELKFLDGTFDLLTAFYTFMYMPDEVVRRSLEEISRVLVPGGRNHDMGARGRYFPHRQECVRHRDGDTSSRGRDGGDGLRCPGETSRTGDLIGNIERAGLTVIEEDRMEHRYFLRARKE